MFPKAVIGERQRTNMDDAECEGEWLVGLNEREKLAFLSLLGHTLTIAGRDSYEVQGEGLTSPAQLRRINEIQHRVLACIREIVIGKPHFAFQRSLPSWLLRQSDAGFQELMSWAWHHSREHFRDNWG